MRLAGDVIDHADPLSEENQDQRDRAQQARAGTGPASTMSASAQHALEGNRSRPAFACRAPRPATIGPALARTRVAPRTSQPVPRDARGSVAGLRRPTGPREQLARVEATRETGEVPGRQRGNGRRGAAAVGDLSPCRGVANGEGWYPR
jgi:hypothetical protein